MIFRRLGSRSLSRTWWRRWWTSWSPGRRSEERRWRTLIIIYNSYNYNYYQVVDTCDRLLDELVCEMFGVAPLSDDERAVRQVLGEIINESVEKADM